MTTPIERMKKILALARRGVGGEKTTAEAMLQRLLAKYEMTIADLDDTVQPVTRHEFNYSTEFERKLISQIVASVLGTRNIDVYRRRGKKTLLVDLTALQYAEVDVRYTAYRKQLRKELAKSTNLVYQAFVQTNDLGVSTVEDDDTPGDIDLDELAAIMAMMSTMRPTPIHRQLETA